MSYTIETAVAEVAGIVKALASTHHFWHANVSQTVTIEKLDQIVNDLTNAVTGDNTTNV
jgi:hypothetical protein